MNSGLVQALMGYLQNLNQAPAQIGTPNLAPPPLPPRAPTPAPAPPQMMAQPQPDPYGINDRMRFYQRNAGAPDPGAPMNISPPQPYQKLRPGDLIPQNQPGYQAPQNPFDFSAQQDPNQFKPYQDYNNVGA